MKNFYLAFAVLLGGILFEKAQAQSIYLKATGAGTSAPLTDNASSNVPTKVRDAWDGSIPDLRDYATVTSLSFDTEQTVTFGSQTGGTGAGKVSFNPLTITKLADASSVKFFLAQCQGKSMTLEILFIAGQENLNVMYKLILKAAFVKTLAGASASGDCSSCPLEESISFEYGSLEMYTYSINQAGKVTANPPGGWSRLTNSIINP